MLCYSARNHKMKEHKQFDVFNLVVYRMPAAGKLSLEDSVPAATK